MTCTRVGLGIVAAALALSACSGGSTATKTATRTVTETVSAPATAPTSTTGDHPAPAPTSGTSDAAPPADAATSPVTAVPTPSSTELTTTLGQPLTSVTGNTAVMRLDDAHPTGTDRDGGECAWVLATYANHSAYPIDAQGIFPDVYDTASRKMPWTMAAGTTLGPTRIVPGTSGSARLCFVDHGRPISKVEIDGQSKLIWRPR